MPTTTKSAIRYPVLSDTANVPRDIGYATADIDGRIVTSCTSATRPASPGAGQPIYETDTGFTLVYSGSRWRRVTDTEIGSQVNVTNPTLGTTMTTIATVTATTVGGTLRVTGSAMFNNGNSGADKRASMQITLDGTPQTPILTDIDVRWISGSGAVAPIAFTWELAAPAAGSHTILLQALATLTSSVNVPAASLIVVEKP